MASGARIAAILRELADALEEDPDATVEVNRTKPRRPRRERRPRELTRPAGEASPEIQAIASRALRSRGFR